MEDRNNRTLEVLDLYILERLYLHANTRINTQPIDDNFHEVSLDGTTAVYSSNQCMQQEITTTGENLAITGDSLRIEESKGGKGSKIFMLNKH